MLSIVATGLLICILGLQVLQMIFPRRALPLLKREGIDADELLTELHGISRTTGGKVHLHEIERVVREHDRR